MADPQRYDLVTNYRCGSSIDELERADDGEWVRYEDVENELSTLRADYAQRLAGDEVLRATIEEQRDALSTLRGEHGQLQGALDEHKIELRSLRANLEMYRAGDSAAASTHDERERQLVDMLRHAADELEECDPDSPLPARWRASLTGAPKDEKHA